MTERAKVLVWVTRRAASGTEVLLLQRAPPWPRQWHPVTGHVEGTESFARGAEREVREETGFTGQARDLAFSFSFEADYEGAPHRYVEHAFAMEVAAGVDPVLSHEHTAFKWAPWQDALEALSFPSQAEALRRAVA